MIFKSMEVLQAIIKYGACDRDIGLRAFEASCPTAYDQSQNISIYYSTVCCGCEQTVGFRG